MNGKLCCVIGFPVAHSLSPLIHTALYEKYSLDCAYRKVEVMPGHIADFVASIPEQNIQGFNVTMPHKTAIIPFLENKPEAKSINTVVVQNGKLVGYSTDEPGFLQSLQEMGTTYEGRRIVFIGAGAVTHALAADAARRGARKISVLNRTIEKAQAIADETGGEALGFDAGLRYECIEDCDILINSTPLGMPHCGDFESYEYLNNISPGALVCDLIYHPPKSRLLYEAEKRGNRILSGMPMLIWQAFYSFQYFFGILPTMEDKNDIQKKITDYLAK